jgi:hypothetical protein
MASTGSVFTERSASLHQVFQSRRFNRKLHQKKSAEVNTADSPISNQEAVATQCWWDVCLVQVANEFLSPLCGLWTSKFKKKCHIYRHSFIDCLNVWQWFFMKQWNMTWISSCGMTEVALAKLPLCWCSTDSTGIFHETLPCFFLGAGCSASAKPLTSWSGVHCNMSESMHMRFLLTLDLFSTGNSHGAISIKPYKTLAQFCQFGVQHQGVLLHYHMIHMTCCKLKPGHLQSGSTQSIGSNSTWKLPRQSKFTIKHTCPRQPRCCLAGPSSLWTLSLHALFHWLVSSPEGWQFYAWVLHPCLRKPR